MQEHETLVSIWEEFKDGSSEYCLYLMSKYRERQTKIARMPVRIGKILNIDLADALLSEYRKTGRIVEQFRVAQLQEQR